MRCVIFQHPRVSHSGVLKALGWAKDTFSIETDASAGVVALSQRARHTKKHPALTDKVVERARVSLETHFGEVLIVSDEIT